MFSKNDYLKYFLQLRKIETSMRDRFRSASEAVDDPALKRFFSRLAREEKAHSRIVDGMLEVFGHKPEK